MRLILDFNSASGPEVADALRLLADKLEPMEPAELRNLRGKALEVLHNGHCIATAQAVK